MEIILGNKVRFKNPIDSYLVTITTSESKFGDHEIKLPFNNNENDKSCLRELIICLEICSKIYSDGNPLTSSYENVPFYKKYIGDRWFSEKFDRYSFYDYLKDYKIRYYDSEGVSYKVSITNDSEMIEIIKKFKI